MFVTVRPDPAHDAVEEYPAVDNVREAAALAAAMLADYGPGSSARIHHPDGTPFIDLHYSDPDD
jgi:hypothetical protein